VAIHADPTDPQRVSKVTVRTDNGIQEIEAAMVAGMVQICFIFVIPDYASYLHP